MLTKEDRNYVLESVLWFAKRVVFGNYLCDVICFKLSRKADCKNDLVLESECLYLKDVLINTITNFDLNCISCCNHVLLEIQERFDTTSGEDLHKLKFKKTFSLGQDTEESYRSFSWLGFVRHRKSSYFSSGMQSRGCRYDFVTSGIYSRTASCSSMALKITNVGVGLTDLGYTGNLKVVIMNHSTDLEFNIKVGDRISQFILTRFEALDVIKVSKFEFTARGSGGLGGTVTDFFSLFLSVSN